MIPYREFAPTKFDSKGLGTYGGNMTDRANWLVCPVSITRDTDEGDISMSNFRVLEKELDELDPDYLDHEQHVFNHWGPGWFEIILVKPDTACFRYADSCEQALEDCPVLDEEDLSEREGP